MALVLWGTLALPAAAGSLQVMWLQTSSQPLPEALGQELRQQLTAILAPAKGSVHWQQQQCSDAAACKERLRQWRRSAQVDLVLVWGQLGARTWLAEKSWSGKTPVVFPWLSPQLAQDFQKGSYAHTAYLQGEHFLKHDLQLLQKLWQPQEILFCLPQALRHEAGLWRQRLLNISQRLGFEPHFWFFPDHPKPGQVPAWSHTDIAYVLPLWGLPASQKQVYGQLRQAGYLVYAAAGERLVRQQEAAAGALPQQFRRRWARRVGLQAQALLQPHEPLLTPQLAWHQRLVLHRQLLGTQRAELPRKWMALAAWVGSPKADLALGQVFAEVRAHNSQLQAQRAGQRVTVSQARATQGRLWPQVTTGIAYKEVDKQQAAASVGMLPQRQWQGQLEVTQPLLVEPLWAAATAARQEIARQEQQVKARALTLCEQAARLYCQISRQQSLIKVQRLQASRAQDHLQVARLRQATGQASPAESYRWQSQRAQERQQLVALLSQKRQLQQRLAQILERPANGSLPQVVPLKQLPAWQNMLAQWRHYLATSQKQRRLARFLGDQRVAGHPRMQRLEAAIAARKRLLTSAQRRFWLPELTGQARFTQVLNESGAGVKTPQFRLAPWQDLQLPEADDSRWQVGLNLQWPLFTGGQRTAQQQEQSHKLRRLRRQQAALRQELTTDIATALEGLAAALQRQHYAQQASKAARQQYQLVKSAYARGTKALLPLWDSHRQLGQSRLQQARLQAEAGLHLVSLAAALGDFQWLTKPKIRQQWWHQLRKAAP